jgi:hypothetical protein
MPGIKESVTLDEVLALLNEAVELDAVAVNALVESRVRCCKALSAHPTIQVVQVDGEEELFLVGLLGILNGCFGVDDRGYGPIAAVVDESPPRVVGFCRLPPGVVERVDPDAAAPTPDPTDAPPA